MLNYLKSDWLKQKHSFNQVILWLAPLITILLTILLALGNMVQNGAYNWWYIIILPGCLAMFCSSTVAKERKKNRHGLFGIVLQKKKLWFSQIILNTIYLLITCFVFFVGAAICGFLFGQTISLLSGFTATVLLFITFAWQIPLWMIVTEKAGAFITIILSLLCNCGISVVCAVEKFWWVPFSIPARLMCSTIGVLPNGLPVETGSALASSNVVLPGVVICVLLFGIVSFITVRWFDHQEVL